MRGRSNPALAAVSWSSGVRGWCDTVPPGRRQDVCIRSRRHLPGRTQLAPDDLAPVALPGERLPAPLTSAQARTSAGPLRSSRSGSGVKGRGGSGGEGSAPQAPIHSTPVRDRRTRSAAGRSSCSGGGEGNACGEVAAGPACTAVRDSKAPTHGTLTVPAPAFAAFVNALKRPGGPVRRRPAHRAACGQITITRRPLVCPARLSAWAAAASARE
ncbi:DUF397 domain-containing protein [Streptomyces althioticus]